MSSPGYVYILTNPSFREDWVKIGKSSRPVDVRSKELDNTAVPLPFEIYATLQSEKYDKVERLVHKTIDRLTDLRIRQNREFFNVMPSVALDILRDIASTLGDAKIEVYKNGKPVVEEPGKAEQKHEEAAKEEDQKVPHHRPRPNFCFSMVGIPIGAELVFTPANLTVRVASDNQVEYEGRLYKLSPFTGTFMPVERRNTSGAYQGAKYFTYKGKVLDDLRTEFESK